MIYRFLSPAVFIWVGLESYKVIVLDGQVRSEKNIILYVLSCVMSFFIFVLVRQAVWVVALYLFGSFIWQKVTRRLEVLGG